MKYLETKDINDIENYCKSRCKKIINEYNKSSITYHRGLYKGYMFGISIVRHISNEKRKTTDTRLYKLFKDEKLRIQSTYIKDGDLNRGLLDSLYDLMNYASSLKV